MGYGHSLPVWRSTPSTSRELGAGIAARKAGTGGWGFAGCCGAKANVPESWPTPELQWLTPLLPLHSHVCRVRLEAAAVKREASDEGVLILVVVTCTKHVHCCTYIYGTCVIHVLYICGA